jgi:hypothetical protein
VAVNVTLFPAQTVVPGLTEMPTDAVDGLLVETVSWFDVVTQGLFNDGGNEMDQLLIVPTSAAATSYTQSVQLPFGLMFPPPIAPNEETVVEMQFVNIAAGLYVFVYGAPVTGTTAAPASEKTVLVKLFPEPPL